MIERARSDNPGPIQVDFSNIAPLPTVVVLVVRLTILVISPAVLVVSLATIAGSCGNCHNVGRVGVRRRKGFGDRGRLTFRPYESPKIIEGSANDRVLQFMDRLELPNVARYCEVDSELLDFAWQTFGATPAGWSRVEAICDFVHGHLCFDYLKARANRTALDGFRERVGVCRDFTHLAITLCRCMNIPARYATGYLGDIGVPSDPNPMDFSAWFEAYLGGHWHTFDARHNRRRIGRVLIGRGRDAGDVPIAMVFGQHLLEKFSVITEEIDPGSTANAVGVS